MDCIDISTGTLNDEDENDSEEPVQPLNQNNEQIIQENQYLHHMNEQLQESITKMKAQLQDALSAVEKSNCFTEQIQQLKDQLQEARALNEQYQKEIEQSKSMTVQNSNVENCAENIVITDQISSLQAQIAKLKNERTIFKQADAEKTEYIDLLSNSILKLKSLKKKMKKKIISLSESNSQMKDLLNEAEAKAKKEEEQKSNLSSEVEQLKASLESKDKQINELSINVCQLHNEIHAKDTAIEFIQKQIESQIDEMAEYENQRSLFDDILGKMNKMAVLSENTILDLEEKLKAKQQDQPKKEAEKSNVNIFNKANILDLKLPFQGEIKDDLEKILKLVQYDPVQRLQLIINELAKTIESITKENFIQKKQLSNLNSNQPTSCEDQGNYKEILASLITYLRNSSNIPENGEDDEFNNFIAEKFSNIDQIIDEKMKEDENYINNSFFMEKDIEKRKEMITNLLTKDDITRDVLIAQFLISMDHNEPKKPEETENANENENNEESVFEENLPQNDLQNTINEQAEQIHKLKETRRKMYDNIKKLQAAKLELQTKDSEQKSKINALELEIDNVQRENNILQLKINVLNHDIAMKNAQINEELEKKDNENKDFQMLQEKVLSLEKDLLIKTQANEDLTNQMQKLQAKLDASKKSHAKATKKLEDSYINKINEMEGRLHEVEEKSNSKAKLMKKNLNGVKQQYEETISTITKQYNDVKTSLEETIKSLNTKLSDHRSDIQKLNEKLRAEENLVDQFTKQNEILRSSNDQNEQELTRIKNEYAKEKKALQAKITSINFTCDAQLNEKVLSLERKYNTKINSFIQNVSETIGKYYNISESSLNEETMGQLLLHAKDDLDKLKYFQSESLEKAQTK
ncbi:hypothetical protein TVAG_040460 [Trichomonas vaginalis G3]|uniref:Uncharacterized protein n=1 Tax=Trichomonas vaginalis (strain ATCC PRA-98 / G3) TaxID=412133 RepID=A2F1U1_TRIV3|nr:biological adhesion protein [Trichomonas vaginalis G3]EAY01141.1 hypothetical protein TVAG_040460 [Trichomonas vaginalis G3]KAI5540520.1 biological adhesion protein [Trichomonas vaginalis G3]|eukprot:XP_001313993.1 hypothetical protein [Trichomonas vaginalis G3]